MSLTFLYNRKEVFEGMFLPFLGCIGPARTSPVPWELRCALGLWNALFIDIFWEQKMPPLYPLPLSLPTQKGREEKKRLKYFLVTKGCG